MCETMSRIICHTSLLKRDDYRLKGLPMSNLTCTLCDMYCIEDIVHIISQCPHFHELRNDMYEEIYRVCPNARIVFNENQESITYYLLGREIPDLDENEMFKLWSISGKNICSMYIRVTVDRMGIG